MILQALLVSKDDLSAETLIQVLAEFGVAVDRSHTAEEAVARLADPRFDQVLVDFDDPEAAMVLEACRRSQNDRHPLVTIALLHDASQMRSILAAGAHFILTRPITHTQAQNTFRAATALLKRERRQACWVAVQAAVSIRFLENKVENNAESNPSESNAMEGILLDLGNDGMDLLAAKPLPTATLIHVSFKLPDGTRVEADATVAWSSANGQAGLRFHNLDATMHGLIGTWLEARTHDASPGEPDAVCGCILTDLSLGGCYVQTESPFPQSSTVDLCLRAAEMEVHTEGLVRVMHPGRGMGIEFPARTREQRKSVGDFIDFLTSQPGATPRLEASPRALVAGGAGPGESGSAGTDPEDPLVELLRTGDGLEEHAFLAALQRQRTPVAVS